MKRWEEPRWRRAILVQSEGIFSAATGKESARKLEREKERSLRAYLRQLCMKRTTDLNAKKIRFVHVSYDMLQKNLACITFARSAKVEDYAVNTNREDCC